MQYCENLSIAVSINKDYRRYSKEGNLGYMDIQTILQIFSIIIVPFFSGIIVLLSWRNNRKTEELKILHGRLNEKKHEAYAKAVSMFYNILKDMHSNRKPNLQKQKDDMTDIKRDIFMYGSDEVFRAFNNWLIHSSNPELCDDKIQFNAFLQFVIEIRKDLCGGSTKIKSEDILINLLQSKEEAKKIISQERI